MVRRILIYSKCCVVVVLSAPATASAAAHQGSRHVLRRRHMKYAYEESRDMQTWYLRVVEHAPSMNHHPSLSITADVRDPQVYTGYHGYVS